MNFLNRLLFQNKIKIVIAQQKVYLVNKTSLKIDRLVYATWSMSQQGKWLSMSSKSYYEINCILPNAAVLLEELDPYEVGKISYRLDYAKIQDKEMVLNFLLHQERQTIISEDLLIDRMVDFLKSEEGFVKEAVFA